MFNNDSLENIKQIYIDIEYICIHVKNARNADIFSSNRNTLLIFDPSYLSNNFNEAYMNLIYSKAFIVIYYNSEKSASDPSIKSKQVNFSSFDRAKFPYPNSPELLKEQLNLLREYLEIIIKRLQEIPTGHGISNCINCLYIAMFNLEYIVFEIQEFLNELDNINANTPVNAAMS